LNEERPRPSSSQERGAGGVWSRLHSIVIISTMVVDVRFCVYDMEKLRSKSLWVLDEISSPLRSSFLQIKEEITTLIEDSLNQLNRTNVESTIPRMNSIESSIRNGRWDVFYFVEEGNINPDFVQFCPQTTQVLRKLPLLLGCSLGYCYVSILSPGAEITPHSGSTNVKLRIQFPILNSSESILTVDGVEHRYFDGEPIIFDDSFQHSVRNCSSNESRVVLLIDIWHPDLSSEHIRHLLAQFPSSLSLLDSELTSMLEMNGLSVPLPTIDLRSIPPPIGPSPPSSSLTFKIILLGDPGVGKTSFMLRYFHDRAIFSTTGLDFVCPCSRFISDILFLSLAL
jgi:hypothetical protein